MTNTDLTPLLIQQARLRIFDESYPRIFKCLDLLTEDQVWERPNEQLSSVGNLVLHLAGNVRQWINSGLGGQEDNRKRDREFLESSRCSKWKLKLLLEDLKRDVEVVLKKLTVEDLVKVRKVQVFEESGLSILVHVMEHFSYHTGQITWQTKMMTNEDTKYYGKLN
jgi:uncharacterized damage-inducible protein DinB